MQKRAYYDSPKMLETQVAVNNKTSRNDMSGESVKQNAWFSWKDP